MSGQRGATAVAVLALGLLTILVLGLLLDTGLVAAERMRLGAAAGAAARAVVRACGNELADSCPADLATRYLQANRATAHVDAVQINDLRVRVEASLEVIRPFAQLWAGPPVQLQAAGAARRP